MPSDLRAVIFMLISTFSLSLNGLMGKVLSQSFSTDVLGFLRFFLPALIMLGILAYQGWAFPTRDTARPIIIRALCVVGSQMCFLYALTTLTLVESVVLFSTGPLFIPVLEKLLYRTPLKGMTLFCLGMTFCGVILQAGGTGDIAMRPELLTGLAAGLFNALSQVTLFKGAKSGLPSAAVNGWCFLLAALIIAPFASMTTFQQGSLVLPDAPLTTTAIITGVTVLALSIASTQMFRVMAYKLAHSGSQLSPLIFTNLVFAFIWQISFFNDTLNPTKILGIGLIVLATLINTFVPHWQAKQTQRMA
ncbi:metabolite transporter (DMT) superfamily [Photobacterium aphoticum]|uniref:Metabolite transporter (DMT) superfamily n=1 Tax=Photobacterium aphoticum TaxID=754436 RepID=A0A090QQI2_9GAMM|nr:metabolite transporter (DMT) superfamily [Photobacterium aphoticum]